MIYLDNAATTYPKPKEVYDALDFAQRNLSFNAGRGSYKQARECSKVLNDLRTEIASIGNSLPDQVVLLSSATEALNIIINGLNIKDGMNIYITPFEHNAIVRPLYNLKKRINFNIHILPFNKITWEPEISKISNLFALNNPDIIFSSQVSNVTGLMIDYSDIFELGKNYNSKTVLDAAQGFGVVPLQKKNVDFIIFAGHKSLYGPFGIGGFINCSNYRLEIVKSGGNGSDTLNHDMPENNHERYESGSPNVPAAYGTLVGTKWVRMSQIFPHEQELTKYLITSLQKIDKITLFLPKNIDNIFGIVSFAVEGYSSDEVGEILSDEFDICVRTGYHCAPFVHDFINSISTKGTVRVSLGFLSSKTEIDTLTEALGTL